MQLNQLRSGQSPEWQKCLRNGGGFQGCEGGGIFRTCCGRQFQAKEPAKEKRGCLLKEETLSQKKWVT